MFCPNCGTQNPDNAVQCFSCNNPFPVIPPPQMPPPYPVSPQYPGNPQYPGMQYPIPVSNYLVQAILVTIFCCLPFGIVAIVYAAQVNGKLQLGDYAGALATSNNAKLWCWISFGTGLTISVIYLALVLTVGFSNLGR